MCEGTLIDISHSGALVRLPTAQTPDRHVTLHLESGNESLKLRARVVRSTPHPVELPGAVLARSEHHVALEFLDLSERVVAALGRIIGGAEGPADG